MEALDGCLFDCPVHALNLTIAPSMIGFCQAIFDPMLYFDCEVGQRTESHCRLNSMYPVRSDAQESFEKF